MAKRNVDIDILKSVEEYIKEISKHRMQKEQIMKIVI